MMDKITLKALKLSIKKWEKIVKSTRATDTGPENCALCELFYYDKYCDDCPVQEKTGSTGCEDTPYEYWIFHQNDPPHSKLGRPAHRFKGCRECLKLAVGELNFLISLLPKKS